MGIDGGTTFIVPFFGADFFAIFRFPPFYNELTRDKGYCPIPDGALMRNPLSGYRNPLLVVS